MNGQQWLTAAHFVVVRVLFWKYNNGMNCKILISGSSGLIGNALCKHFLETNHQVVRLVRRKPQEHEIEWDPYNAVVDSNQLEGFDVWIHLGGVSIADRRWNVEYKKAIWESRVRTTECLAQAVRSLTHKPKVFISASAVGIYGDRKDELLDESSLTGAGFFGDLGRAWEATAQFASDVGVRVVNTRIGIVLSRGGGALSKMLIPFRWGIGAKLGSGTQYMSWISICDLVRAFDFVIHNDSLIGPVNVVSPNPVTNKEFTKILASVIKRPAVLSVPSFALRILFGEMANEALLASQRVVPDKLLKAGFRFRFPFLKETLKSLLEKQ